MTEPTTDLNHWSELVINTFLCIAGTNRERVDQIYLWFEDFLEENISNEYDAEKIYRQIENFCKSYFRPE